MTAAALRQVVHGTTVALNGQGVLLRGQPGSGKSDLALRLLDGAGGTPQAQLVADDQTVLTIEDGQLCAAPPPALAGKLELRGFGIVSLPYLPRVPLRLVVDLMPWTAIERMPEPGALTVDLCGQRLARCQVDAAQASAPARIRLILQAMLNSTFPA